MTIFSANNISKTYGERLLFDNVAFGMEEGEKVGIIGKNGIGKTTLMRIIAGLEDQDSGEVVFNNETTFEFLDQLPEFETEETVLEAVLSSDPVLHQITEEYRDLCERNRPEDAPRMEEITHILDEKDAWNYENEAMKVLTELGMTELHKQVKHLSGGLKKRVALAKALLSKPKLLILDEPTNHLDADSVQWLQDRLSASNISLLFVTHDRYFLDAVSTRIIEISEQRIFNYPGNYEKYLEQKEIYMQTKEATLEHNLSRLRTELEWLKRGARARRSKQKSKIDWIDELKKHSIRVKEKKIEIELGNSFLSSRVIDAQDITKTLGNRLLFNRFTYIAKPKDRIGIIGPNGSGKSTLLKTLCGRMEPDQGNVLIGASTKFGYFEQEIESLKPTQTVLGTIREVAEYINVGVGKDRYLTCRDLLDKFLFPRKQQGALIETLSGGEKRRLALVRVLMANPNVLLFDEPTNDFDLETLTALEEYLDNFLGVLIIVSHDRAFLDRTVEFIYAFDGKGNIKQYPGNYSIYLEKKEEEIRKAKAAKKDEPKDKNINKPKNTSKKLPYMEQREFDKLEKEIPELEEKKQVLEDLLASGTLTDYKELEDKAEELKVLEEKIDESTMRWLELSEKQE